MDPLKTPNQPVAPNGTQPPVPAPDTSSQLVSPEVEVSLNNEVKPEQGNEQYSAAEPALNTVADASAQPAPAEPASPAESTAPTFGAAPTETPEAGAPSEVASPVDVTASTVASDPVVQDGQATPAPAVDGIPADPNQPTPASADPLNVAPPVVPKKNSMIMLVVLLVIVVVAAVAAFVLPGKL